MLRFARYIVFVMLAFSAATSPALAVNDFDPTFWNGTNPNAAPSDIVLGMNADYVTEQLTTISFVVANTNFGVWQHVMDLNGQNYNHVHWYDFDGNGGTDYSAADQAKAQTYWDFAMGLDPHTGNGKLDGDTISRDTTALGKTSLNRECGAYAFTCAGGMGQATYSFADGDTAYADLNAMTDPYAPQNVQGGDILQYTNGTWNIGYHYSYVQQVTLGVPSILQWKYAVSGGYVLNRSRNYFYTPMFWTGATSLANNVGKKPADWSQQTGGAGDGDFASVGVFRPHPPNK